MAASYRPDWQEGFQRMTSELEELRATAESLWDAGDSLGAAQAWLRLEEQAEAAYGFYDPRRSAASSRAARSLLEAGALKIDMLTSEYNFIHAENMLASLEGPRSPEALYALETSARINLALDWPVPAVISLRKAAGMASEALGPQHPQTLSSERWLAAADAATRDSKDSVILFRRIWEELRDSRGPTDPETLEAAGTLARLLETWGDLEGGLELLEGSLEARRKASGARKPRDLGAAEAARALASAMERAGRFPEARDLYAGALETLTGELGPTHQAALDAKLGMARSLIGLGEPAAARELVSEVQAERELGSTFEKEHNRIVTRMVLAAAFQAEGQSRTALRLFSGAGYKLQQHFTVGSPRDPYVLAARAGEAGALLDMGEFAAALAILEVALVDYEAMRTEQAERKAEALAKAARENDGGEPGPGDTAEAEKDGDGAEQGNQGDAGSELKGGAEPESGREGGVWPPSRFAAEAEAAMGEAYLGLGDYSRARDILERARAGLAASLGDSHPETLAATAALAVAMGGLGKSDEARRLLSSALEGQEKVLGPMHPTVLSTRSSLGAQLLAAGEPAEALSQLERAVEGLLEVRGEDHPETLAARVNLAAALLAAGKAGAARDLLTGVLEAAVRVQGAAGRLVGAAAAGLGDIWAREGDLALAVFWLKVSVTAAEEARGRATAMDGGLRRCLLFTFERRYHRLFDALMRSDRPAEALVVLGLLKEDELPPRAPSPLTGYGGGRVESPGPWLSAAVGLFEGSPDDAAWRHWLAAGERDMVAAAVLKLHPESEAGSVKTPESEAALAELEAAASAASMDFREACDRIPEILERDGTERVPPGALDGILALQRRLAGTGSAVVYAVSADDTLYLVMIAGDFIALERSDADRDRVEETALRFRELVQNPYRDPRPAGKELYGLILAPLEDELERARASSVLFSLDGALRYVPMAALWDGERWLAERMPSAIVTGSTAALAERWAAEPVREDGPPEAAAMGVTAAWPGFPALPGVAVEIAAVVGGKGAGGVLRGEGILDADFDRAALARALASGAPVVHVASHFALDPESTSNSVLLLGDGTMLSLDEMSASADLDFRGLDLLTLSACETGSGARLRKDGREVESLGELLQRAGASSVLAALLPADDGSAPALMREFYRLRYAEGLGKAEALRGAQLALMRDSGAKPGGERGTALLASGRPAYGGTGPTGTEADEAASAVAGEVPRWEGKGFSHPHYWAPFVVIGDWR
jgi:CHAT domain-containing protein/Tfp pilus assembly protein PilF